MAKLKFRKWLNQLLGTFIQGGATAAGATFGLAGANSMGIAVTPLDAKQVIGVFLCGAVARALEYLKKSPVPNFDGNTELITKNENNNEPN
jgi:hypothetical protein